MTLALNSVNLFECKKYFTAFIQTAVNRQLTLSKCKSSHNGLSNLMAKHATLDSQLDFCAMCPCLAATDSDIDKFIICLTDLNPCTSTHKLHRGNSNTNSLPLEGKQAQLFQVIAEVILNRFFV